MEPLFLMFLGHTQRRSTVGRTPLDEWLAHRRDLYLTKPGAWIFVCCECRVLSGRGLCEELITRSEESYRLYCVVLCDLETSGMGAPYIYIYIYIYIYDIRRLRFKFLYLHLFNIKCEHTCLHIDQTAQVRLVCSKRQTPFVILIVQWHLRSRPLHQEVIKISH